MTLAFYDNAIKNLREAQAAHAVNRTDICTARIRRAQAEIMALREVLDQDAEMPELYQQLDALYVFTIDQLEIAVAAKTERPIAVVVNILVDMRIAASDAIHSDDIYHD
jgi:flagellin-specific chaperone FliS